ncbi:MAG: hypothetical protein V3S82_05650 [Dehalococcoidia bacterium]
MRKLSFLILIIPLVAIGCFNQSIPSDQQQLLFEKDDIIASLEQEIEELQNVNPSITMTITPLGRSGNGFRYRTVLQEERGVDIYITALVREHIETGNTWTYGRDYLLDRVGSFTVRAYGRLEWETEFDLTGATLYFQEYGEITYRESWYGMDAEGKAIGVSSSISTNAYK